MWQSWRATGSGSALSKPLRECRRRETLHCLPAPTQGPRVMHTASSFPPCPGRLWRLITPFPPISSLITEPKPALEKKILTGLTYIVSFLPLFWSMVFKLQQTSESPDGRVQSRSTNPLEFLIQCVLGWGLRICISKNSQRMLLLLLIEGPQREKD